MPTIERREVPLHERRAHWEELAPGVPYLLACLGTVFALLGLGCLGCALLWAAGDGPDGSGFAVWTLFGLPLLGMGIAFWTPLRNRFRLRRKPPFPSATPLPRWRRDRDWDPTWVRSEADRLRGHAVSFLWMGGTFTLAVLAVPKQEKLWFGAYLWGAFLLAAFCKLPYYLARAAKFAGSRLRLPYCPLPLGEELTVYLCDLDRLKGARSLTVTLRFLAEVREQRRSGRSSAWTWNRYAHFEEVRSFRPQDLPFGAGAPARVFRLSRPGGPGTELPLRFQLPEDERFDTQLATNPPCYWELEVKADLPGIDYLGLFLLPVYAKGWGRRDVPEDPIRAGRR